MLDNAPMQPLQPQPGVNLTTDLSHDDAIPYFLWDQPMTVSELRRRLSGPPEERYRYLGKILREAREPDVWRFTTPAEVIHQWDRLEPQRVVGGIRMDSAQEILVNKLCALLSRVEIRDLVDVMALQASGLDPIAAVWAASGKDAGITPSQLAWVLSSFPIPEGADLPGGVAPKILRDFRDDLIRRLAATAFPEPA